MNTLDAQRYFELGYQTEHTGDLQSALIWYEQALKLARQTGNNNIEMLSLSNMVQVCIRSGSSQRAVEIATSLLEISRQINAKPFEMRALGRLTEAVLFIDGRKRYSEAVDLIKEGSKIAKDQENSFWRVYFNILSARAAIAASNFDLAINALQTALNDLNEKVDDYDVLKSLIYERLSFLHLKYKDYEKSLHYGDIAAGVSKKTGAADLLCQAQLTVSWALYGQGQIADAYKMIKDILDQTTKFKWFGLEGEAKYLGSLLSYKLGFIEDAEAWARQAVELSKQTKQKEQQVHRLLALGQILFTRSKAEAIDILEEAQELSLEQDYSDLLVEAQDWISRIKL